MNEAVLDASGLVKSFAQGPDRVEVLQGVDLSVQPGERVAVIGRSGSGKSTLLHLLAGLDDADAGSVRVGGHDVTGASPARRAWIRNRYMGFVYQLHHLLPEFSALENVAMPFGSAACRRPRSRAAGAARCSMRSGSSHRLNAPPGGPVGRRTSAGGGGAGAGRLAARRARRRAYRQPGP